MLFCKSTWEWLLPRYSFSVLAQFGLAPKAKVLKPSCVVRRKDLEKTLASAFVDSSLYDPAPPQKKRERKRSHSSLYDKPSIRRKKPTARTTGHPKPRIQA